MSSFTHFNEDGRARMVDISDKTPSVRTAAARTSVQVSEEIYSGIKAGTMKKGDVLQVAPDSRNYGSKKNIRSHPHVSSDSAFWR